MPVRPRQWLASSPRSFGTSATTPRRAWRRRARNAGRRVDARPGGEFLQRIARQFRCGDLRQLPRVKRPRPYPRQAGEIAFALQHREVEPDRVPDHHRPTEKRV